MTKRDPFARVELDSTGSLVLRCGQVDHVFWDSDKGYLQRAADLINAAHDKDVREAVEEFRERAATLAYTHSNEVGGFCACMEEISNKIRKLPTEGK